VACEYSTTAVDIMQNPDYWIIPPGSVVIQATKGLSWLTPEVRAAVALALAGSRMWLIRQACRGQVYGH
jgi:hypothetical protein